VAGEQGTMDEGDRLGVAWGAVLEPGEQSGRVVGGDGWSGLAEVGLEHVGGVGVSGVGTGGGEVLVAGMGREGGGRAVAGLVSGAEIPRGRRIRGGSGMQVGVGEGFSARPGCLQQKHMEKLAHRKLCAGRQLRNVMKGRNSGSPSVPVGTR
jgi:hypothetical protein